MPQVWNLPVSIIPFIFSAGFGGCIKDVGYKLKSTANKLTEINLSTDFSEAENVRFDGCPRKVVSEATCRPNIVEKIYDGTNNGTFDYGLEPFTGLSLVSFRAAIIIWKQASRVSD